MQVDIDASRARGTGVKPEDPPLRWEVSQGDGIWEEAEVLSDTTGGFNYGRGAVEVQCPGSAAAETVGGKRLRWLRCRISARTRAGNSNAAYTHPPEIYSIGAVPVGALVPVEHAACEIEESLGTSDGTPGQIFRLRFAPVLAPEQDETLEVRDPGSERWDRWTRVDSFAVSGPTDRHFKVDLHGGELELGPALRQRHGGWTQYGQVPPHGAELRMTRYRHGGGARGNVAAGSLNVLRTAIPGIDHVVNPKAASGGVDGEPIDSARRRAALELRTRHRAVTAEDYEFLVHEASSRVGRAICLPPASSGAPIEVRVLPRIQPADRMLTSEELTPDPELLKTIGMYLDSRRVIGTTVHVLPVRLRGVSVVVNLQADPEARLRRVEEEVLQALYTYINPLCGGLASGPAEGWSFGRMLNQGELYQIVHSVEGVQFVKILRVYETDLRSGEQSAQPASSHLELDPDELIASATHIVKATHPEIS
jgi:predicted phage baseplate assembly protein